MSSSTRVAIRFLRLAREWKPDQIAMRFRDTKKRVLQYDEEWARFVARTPPGPIGRWEKSDLADQWWWLKHDAEYAVDWVLETRAIPSGKAKQVELLARAFKAYAKAPGNVIGWWMKNRPLLNLLLDAEGWPEKSLGGGEGDVQEVLAVGPFTVHNTLHLTGEKLAATVSVIEGAVSALERAGSRLSKVLYGDVRVVGQLMKSRTLAWYLPNHDEVYLRPHLKVGRGEVHNLIHELGHRFWGRELDQGHHILWHREFDRIEGKGITVPKVGDVVPVKARGYTDPVVVTKDEGYRYQLSSGGTIEKMRLVQFMRARNREESFPTPYAASKPEEYFAECFAMFVLGTLQPEHVERFERIARP